MLWFDVTLKKFGASIFEVDLRTLEKGQTDFFQHYLESKFAMIKIMYDLAFVFSSEFNCLSWQGWRRGLGAAAAWWRWRRPGTHPIHFSWGDVVTSRLRIYVPSGWKHYARDRKTLRRTFVSRGKNGCFFDRREKNNFFRGKQMFFSEFFWPRHNVFSLKDTFSWGFILWPTINLYILMGSDFA